MSGWWYEIFLGQTRVDTASWSQFFAALKSYLGWRARWSIRICLDHGTLHYYLETLGSIPTSLGVADFLCKPLPDAPIIASHQAAVALPFLTQHKFYQLPRLLHKLQERGHTFISLNLKFSSCGATYFTTTTITFTKKRKTYERALPLSLPAELCSIDFSKFQNFRYKKIPTYLNSEKVHRITSAKSTAPLLLLDNFPYGDTCGLDLTSFDFAKHSLVLGSSGSGKSRFLCLLIDCIYRSSVKDYKVIVIDPHDALKNDLGEVQEQVIVDFYNSERSVDLFQQDLENLSVSVELMLETFRSLIGDSYNGRLERVLRHTIYLLLLDQNFTFVALRRILSETEYRNEVLTRLKSKLPSSVSRFFLTEFQELKSQSYNLAFAPIMAFIDEMQMLTVFNETGAKAIPEVVAKHFLSVFSLSRLRLGDKVTRTIAGLLMQQLFLLAQKRQFSEHLVIIIDEVAVIENPILVRFLSEMRKYNVSVILAGQYFAQMSPNLRTAILANASNYYTFRIARGDARLLVDNLQIKSPKLYDMDSAAQIFTGLKARECLVQISCHGEPYAVFKAQTPDYNPRPNLAIPPANHTKNDVQADGSQQTLQLLLDTDFTVEEIMLANTTNRKKLSKEKND